MFLECVWRVGVCGSVLKVSGGHLESAQSVFTCHSVNILNKSMNSAKSKLELIFESYKCLLHAIILQ